MKSTFPMPQLHMALATLLLSTALPTFAALPPKYLAVPQFQQCLVQKTVEQYQIWCVPEQRPKACPLASWQQLLALKNEGELTSCRSQSR